VFAEGVEKRWAPPPHRSPPPHTSPQCTRLGCDISFSTAGGVEIEENWDKVKSVTLPTGQAATSECGDGGGWLWGCAALSSG